MNLLDISPKTYRRIMENVIKRLVKESEEGSQSPFEEYVNDYPDGSFDVSDMTPEDLADWCKNSGDFLYVYPTFHGKAVLCANTRDLKNSIISDLYNCDGIEPTHEVDALFYNRENEFVNYYVCIFKINGTPDGDYYIVYQQDKDNSFNESVSHLNEAFNSSNLRNWFKEHGGVKRLYTEDEYGDLIDKRVYQDGLGDITDDMITYTQEFNDYNEAVSRMRMLTQSDHHNMRSSWDMSSVFFIYKAQDGMFLLVGVDRSKMPMGITWGGETTKKVADRRMANGWNYKTRSNRYVDDSDTYYYNSDANDFDIHNSNNFKQVKDYNQKLKNKMSDDEWNEYMKKRAEKVRSYRK